MAAAKASTTSADFVPPDSVGSVAVATRPKITASHNTNAAVYFKAAPADKSSPARPAQAARQSSSRQAQHGHRPSQNKDLGPVAQVRAIAICSHATPSRELAQFHTVSRRSHNSWL